MVRVDQLFLLLELVFQLLRFQLEDYVLRQNLIQMTLLNQLYFLTVLQRWLTVTDLLQFLLLQLSTDFDRSSSFSSFLFFLSSKKFNTSSLPYRKEAPILS